MAAPAEPAGIEGYLGLRDVRVELDLDKSRGGEEGVEGGGGGFAVCFWLYLSGSARPSPVILHQITSGDGNKLPFLALSEGNKLLLFPLLRLHKQAPSSSNSSPWTDTTYISAVNECPLEQWIHIGCEVTENVMRLHIDGDLVAEAHLCSLSSQPDNQDDAYQVCLLGNDGKVDGYVYNIQVLSMLGTIHEQYAENPPSKLSIDYSCCDGIEEGDDGIWCIVGGKASCRRNFMLEVVLTNTFGEHVNKDTQIVASLVYADNGALVEKSRDDAEPPLLIACEGLEYPAESRPLPILRGRALFKLKISQLSSKCDNKLFRIYFSTLHTRKYPFLEASSKPIRCISRGRPSRPLSVAKRTSSATIDEIYLLNNGQGLDRDGKANACSLSHDQSSVACLHPSKFLKVEGDGAETHKMVSQSKQARKMVVEAQSVRTESTMSDSDSIDARSSWSGSDKDEAETLSDAMIFRYCLEGTYERPPLHPLSTPPPPPPPRPGASSRATAMLPARFLKLSLLRRLGTGRAAGVPPPWQTRLFPVRGYQSRGYSAGGSSKYDKPMRQFAEENESNSRPLIYYIVPSAILAFAGLATYVHYNDEKRAVPLGKQAQQTSIPKRCTTNRPAIGGPFKLYDTENNVVTESKLRGNWTLMYFGYTSSPDVGPKEVQKIADVVKLLESKYGIKIKPLFVTLDPQRDSPAQLKAYLSEFDPRIIGLTGSVDAIRQMAQEYRIFFKKVGEVGQDYIVESSHNMYLLDPCLETVRCFGAEYKASDLAEAVTTEIQKASNSAAK